jgi:hypothetical protein
MTLANRKRKYARFIKDLQRNCLLLQANGVSVRVCVKSDYKLAMLAYEVTFDIVGKQATHYSFFEIEPGYIDSIYAVPNKGGKVDDELGPIL